MSWNIFIYFRFLLWAIIKLNVFSILQLPWPSLPIYQRCSGAATTFIYPFTFLSVPKTCMTCKCWVNTRNFHNTRQLQEEHSSKATFLSPRISQYKVIKRAHITNTVGEYLFLGEMEGSRRSVWAALHLIAEPTAAPTAAPTTAPTAAPTPVRLQICML